MTEYIYDVYESIVNNTNSELILFFIIVAVLSVPFYMVVLKGRKAAKEYEKQRESQLIKVIQENTSVIAELKVVVDANKIDTKAMLDRIHTRIDEINLVLKSVIKNVVNIDANLDNLIAIQVESPNKIDKVLSIASTS